MVRKIVETVTDDIDGSKAESTIKFGLDGQGYEIDVSPKNEQRLRKIFAPYLLNARAVVRRRTPSRRRASTRSVPPAAAVPSIDSAAARRVREWARSQGLEVSARGRIPRNIVEQYNESNAQ
ncbi:Lsr2 protein [Sinosporangium album]|uniref:Lsr2 protein n=1 Tax=Sinosporangium album TaxID=504805 RepID=A0A1G8ABY6_9ACTN|nr:Lsr2 family protein [Sinosporangium album]SDH18383.1 Lsr2 protein [Sinosporangium album]